MTDLANRVIPLVAHYISGFEGYRVVRANHQQHGVYDSVCKRMDQVPIWHMLHAIMEMAEAAEHDTVEFTFRVTRAVSESGYADKSKDMDPSAIVRESLAYAWTRKTLLADPGLWNDLTSLIDRECGRM